jgi:hypothetical protein
VPISELFLVLRRAVRTSILVMGSLAACRNPVSPGSEHLEAVEIRIRDASGRVVASTVDNARWTGGSLHVSGGAGLELLPEFTNVNGEVFTLAGRREHTLRGEVEAPRMVGWTTTDGRGRLVGFLAGSTRIRFHIWHGTHADFSSPWLEVQVTPSTMIGASVP